MDFFKFLDNKVKICDVIILPIKALGKLVADDILMFLLFFFFN